MALQFKQADLAQPTDRNVLTRFNIDYMTWIAENVHAHFKIDVENMIGATIPDYVAARSASFVKLRRRKACSTSCLRAIWR